MKIPLPVRTALCKGLGSVIIFLLILDNAYSQGTCAAALTLTPAAICSTAGGTPSSRNGNMQNALTASPAGACGGTLTTTYSQWYKFTATATSHIITVTGTGSSLPTGTTYVEVLSGACGTLTSVICQNVNGPLGVSGLTSGTTYYVRVYVTSNPTGGAVANWAFTICLLNTTPANDNCSNATTLTSAATCSTTAGTLVYATNSGVAGNCGGATSANTYDVWYKFTATATSHVVTLGSLGSGLTASSTYMELLSGTCAGGFTSLFCQSASSSMSATGLTIGTTYYVRAYTTTLLTANAGFTICVFNPTAPSNDNCLNATALTSAATCATTSGSLQYATNSGLAGNCGGATSATTYDVWYQFTAVATSHIITLGSLSGLTAASTYIEILSGNCSGGFTSLFCQSASSSMTATGLTAGTTYYVRVYVTTFLTAAATFNICIQNPPSYDDCMGAVPLTSGTVCSTTTGTLQYATSSGIAGNCGGATSATTYDVWYQFVANSTSHTITLGSLTGLIAASTYIELLNGNCTSGFTSLACQSASAAMNATGLTPGITYYVRVYVTTIPTAASSFTICITNTITNDNCSGATSLTEVYGTTPTTAGNFSGATSSGIATTCGLSTYPDVWYSFVATSQSPVITISSLGTNLTTAKTYIQVFSGTCAGLTSIGCVSGAITYTPAGLTIGNTYYVRVSENISAPTGANNTFQIVVSNLNANVDYGKSYVRIKGGIQPGTIIPGDTLQIRATFVVKSNTAYKCTYTDNIPANTVYVPNSLKILTNEGVTFQSFPDATTTDAGIATGYPGIVTAVTINMGTGATSATGGSVVNTANPSFYGSACIMVLSYEVVVPALLPYNTKIGVGKGTLSYDLTSGATATVVTFPADTLIVYNNYGICSNTVGTNAVTSEFSGTFGSGNAKNRYASSKVPSNYTDTLFTNNSPQDYYYGISNNTSAAGVGYSTVNSWAYPDNSLSTATPANSHRLFSLEDIIGDHTGATNPLLGNPPADTTGGSTGGYMVFVNAAYRTDIAFLDTIKNLCPNTYYQYSAWFRNMCSKCSCDYTGKGAGTAGYLPNTLSGVNDSSGVHPNMTFNINGYDYYTTGDILYTGQWIQKGFTYVTGPTDTAMIINVRNNAPGGGGNDWVIDDIGVATCAPNVQLTPDKVDNLCMGADDTVRFKVSSYFNSYTYYQIQKSIDGGVTWTTPGTDTTGAPANGTGLPVYNAGTGNYEYTATRYYQLNTTDTVTTYRLIVATTSANLSNSNCSAYATAQKIVTSADCNTVLATNIILFKGHLDNGYGKLQWVTTNETPGVTYTVERSTDQTHFEAIGTLDGTAPEGLGATYNFTDPKAIGQPTYYRIFMQSGKYSKYSTIVLLSNNDINFDVQSVTNPFTDWLAFDMTVPQDAISTFTLIDMYGRVVKQERENVSTGLNTIRMYNLSNLAAGTYTLQVQYTDKIISKHVIKFSSN